MLLLLRSEIPQAWLSWLAVSFAVVEEMRHSGSAVKAAHQCKEVQACSHAVVLSFESVMHGANAATMDVTFGAKYDAAMFWRRRG